MKIFISPDRTEKPASFGEIGRDDGLWLTIFTGKTDAGTPVRVGVLSVCLFGLPIRANWIGNVRQRCIVMPLTLEPTVNIVTHSGLKGRLWRGYDFARRPVFAVVPFIDPVDRADQFKLDCQLEYLDPSPSPPVRRRRRRPGLLAEMFASAGKDGGL